MPFAFCLSSRSQTETTSLHQWGAVTLFHGLPSDRVRAIAQGQDGVMWFGTDAGLARYDGRRIQTVPGEELAGRRVLALRFDEAGVLWVGTDDGALVSVHEGQFESVAETKGKAVAAIITPESGRAILATSDGFIFECRRQTNESFVVRALVEQIKSAAGKPLELTSLASVGETLLVGTRGRGLLIVERGGAVREASSRTRSFVVEAIEQDERGRVVFGAQAYASESGLFAAGDSGASRLNKIADGATGTVTALGFERRRGDLFAGSDGQGVFRYRGSRRLQHFTFEGTAGGLRSNRVYSVFVDREGVAWFGTDRGVCRYDPQGVRVEDVSEDAAGNFVRSLYRTSNGRLLCGTNRGLFVRDEASQAWRAVEGVANKTVYAVAEDRDGLLLVGTAGGLYVGLQTVGRTATGAVRLTTEDAGADEKDDGKDEGAAVRQSNEPALSGSVRAIAVLGGVTYIATFGRGVERFETGQRRALVWPRAGDDARLREVVSLYADNSSGRLWIGTANAGVFYFDGSAVKTETALAALSRSAVWGVGGGAGADGRGWLWLATGSGLYAYRPGGALLEIAPGVDARGVFAVPTAATGGSSSNVAAAAHFAQAWCATAGGGVIKVSIDEQFGAVSTRLDAERGLPSQNAFAVLPLEAGADGGETSLLVGTTRGLARYEPGGEPPRLKLTRVTTSRTHQPEELSAGALRLEYPQNSLVMDVSATSSRTFPEQFQYSFLLTDGAGRAIKQKLSHDSQFQIEQLPPGVYRIVARAYTIDLVASVPLVFEFEVARAPFPRTTVALSVLLALALVALSWGYVQHRKTVRSREALVDANHQLAAARLQLANEAEAERRRIARDLHDQTLADLRRLLLMTDEIQREGVAASTVTGENGHTRANVFDPIVLRAEIESISHEIRRICEDLSPSVLDNVGFAAALEWALAEQVSHLPADCKFTYEFACDEDLEERLHFKPGVRMQVYRIVQEAVSNICRHAQATHVRLAIHLSEDEDFVLTMEDNGRGFDTQHRKARGGRGLANISARASLIEAEVEWRRREDTGTIFVLRKLPEKQTTAAG
ncbi:MAG: hypothetical protein LC754_13295 [Acidobacteria bacterium]|nr:hypothetical protein [Acidobacteriota bacterium]